MFRRKSTLAPVAQSGSNSRLPLAALTVIASITCCLGGCARPQWFGRLPADQLSATTTISRTAVDQALGQSDLVNLPRSIDDLLGGLDSSCQKRKDAIAEALGPDSTKVSAVVTAGFKSLVDGAITFAQKRARAQLEQAKSSGDLAKMTDAIIRFDKACTLDRAMAVMGAFQRNCRPIKIGTCPDGVLGSDGLIQCRVPPALLASIDDGKRAEIWVCGSLD